MYLTKCVSSFAEVAAQGPELAFVVYPEGISLMGKAAPFFSVLFFIMMLALGFGSEVKLANFKKKSIYLQTKKNTPTILVLNYGVRDVDGCGHVS